MRDMEALALKVVERYPWAVLCKDGLGCWRFMCAAENESKALYLADALKVGQGLEVKVQASGEAA